ncbi:MAG: hypothetical protein ABWY36_02240 [Leifsonia sp.]
MSEMIVGVPTRGTLRRLAGSALASLLAFGAISAIGGGASLLLTNGLGMPLAMLDGSPFSSFIVPAIVLLVVVGGTQSVGFGLLIVRRPSSLLWSAAAGFGMTIWILVETAIIQGFSVLQAIYFSLGILELALVIGILWAGSTTAAGTPAPGAARTRNSV